MKKGPEFRSGPFFICAIVNSIGGFFLFDFMKKVPAAEQPKIISLPQSKREKVLSIRHCPSHK
jgi:hypothetical protein